MSWFPGWFKARTGPPVERLQHVCHTELQFKHSPAVRIAVLREKWRRMSDNDVWQEVTSLAQDFARGSPEGEAFWVMHIVKECRMKLGRTKVIHCHKCDAELTVVP